MLWEKFWKTDHLKIPSVCFLKEIKLKLVFGVDCSHSTESSAWTGRNSVCVKALSGPPSGGTEGRWHGGQNDSLLHVDCSRLLPPLVRLHDLPAAVHKGRKVESVFLLDRQADGIDTPCWVRGCHQNRLWRSSPQIGALGSTE